ncbi:MAG: hypothetical protein R6X32_00785 [Chloroflexota bacterium]
MDDTITQTQLPTPWQEFTALIPRFHELAQFIVAEIQDFQPDLVLGLAHSGWLPVLAAQTVWSCQSDTPFPPTLRINFGREKLESYQAAGDGHHSFLLDHSPDVSLGHILAWVSRHQSWQTELQQMLRASHPTLSPQRILVVDECLHFGTTYYPLMGLLQTLFPAAPVRFIAGSIIFWGYRATMAWLGQHEPDLTEPLDTESNVFRNPDHTQATHLHNALRWVAAGTEDGDPDSLACLPVDKQSQTIARLSAYLPADRWLEISPWAYKTVLAHIRQHATTPPEGTGRLWRRNGLSWQQMVTKELWCQGSLSRSEIVALAAQYGAGAAATKAIRTWLSWQRRRDLIVAQNWGRATRYQPSPSFRPDLNDSRGPQGSAYWVIPDRLLAGPHFLEASTNHAGLRWLHAQEVETVLDLTGHRQDFWVESEVSEALAEYNETTPFLLDVQQISWPPHKTPTRQQLLEALQCLEAALAAGKRVYIQSICGTGRAALLAAAYLVRQGESPHDAWRFLVQQWEQTIWGPYRRLPDTEGQRRFLLRLDNWLRP